MAAAAMGNPIVLSASDAALTFSRTVRIHAATCSVAACSLDEGGAFLVHLGAGQSVFMGEAPVVLREGKTYNVTIGVGGFLLLYVK